MASAARIAIAGIHTDIGKTIASAILAEALEADYWKPVQAGSLDASDSMTVSQLLSNKKSIVHSEAITLQMAASPHKAAANEQRHFDFKQFAFPQTDNILLIETAGGLMSPMDAQHTMADFISYYQLPTLLVTRHYLGSINHTLLCLEVMKQRGIPLLGLVISGVRDHSSESFIQDYTGDNIPLLYAAELEHINAATVRAAAVALDQDILKSILYGYYQGA